MAISYPVGLGSSLVFGGLVPTYISSFIALYMFLPDEFFTATSLLVVLVLDLGISWIVYEYHPLFNRTPIAWTRSFFWYPFKVEMSKRAPGLVKDFEDLVGQIVATSTLSISFTVFPVFSATASILLGLTGRPWPVLIAFLIIGMLLFITLRRFLKKLDSIASSFPRVLSPEEKRSWRGRMSSLGRGAANPRLRRYWGSLLVTIGVMSKSEYRISRWSR